MIARATVTWLPTGPATDVVVEHEGSWIQLVRPARPDDPPAADGLLIPGTVNAHTHVDLSNLAGRVPPLQLGFPDWLRRMRAARPPDDDEAPRRAAESAFAAGVAAIGDVSSGAHMARMLTNAGLTGVIWLEMLGFDPARRATGLAAAGLPVETVGAFQIRPGAHGVYSTHPDLLRAALSPRGGIPASVHVAEDPAEAEFLAGNGPWPVLLDEMGVDWRGWTPPGGSPVSYLSHLGLIRSHVLAVHGVWLDEGDRALLARARCPVILCPRSNLHIGGQLPDVPALLRSGVRLALGTDSLASCASLDPLDEIPELVRAFPEIQPGLWLDLATAGGADALGLPRHGRIRPRTAPGLVLLEGVRDPRDLASTSPPRRWIAPPAAAWAGPEETPC